MAVQVKNAGRDAVNDALNNYFGNGCSLEVYSSAYGTLLLTYTWGGSTKIYAASSGGVMAGNAPIADTVAAANAGTTAVAQIKGSGGTIVAKDFTVGTSGTDFIIDNATVTAGQYVTLLYATSTVTAPNPGF
jgi:flagellar basal body P-ring protein FlgI